MMVEERMNNGPECSTFAVGCVKTILETEEEGGNENLGSFSVVVDDEGLRTYKRKKKRRRVASSNKETANQFKDDQKIKQPHNTAMQSNYSDQDGQCSADYVHCHWRNVVLKHISQSLDMGEGTEGGIRSCIQDALASSLFSSPVIRKLHGASEKTAHTQEAASFHENGWKERTGVSSDGSQAEPNNQTDVRDTTQLCQSVFLNVLVSEKFALLCRLLCENFQGIKVDNFSDFGVINSRMREGTYGQAPIRFSADMQEIWRKFEKIGEEMVSLAKGLSNMSRKSYLDQVGSIVNCNCRVGNHEGINQTGSELRDSSGLVTKKWCASLESDRQTRREQREFRGSKTMICRRCRVNTGEADSLVCDSCEEIYHVSCIEPAVDEIPQSWYCANCVAIGVELPHENCVVCERLNVIRTQVQADGKGPIAEEIVCDSVEKFVSSKKSKICKLCGGGEENMRKMKQCEHRYCPNRFYHVGCLNVEQLEYHGPHWYCPSCLCTACLIDQDDDKIVLCDGCDHAYHTHCMEPPRSSIPEGKWFCKHCEAGIQALHKAKSAYENLDKRRRSTRSSGARDRAGGSVDMLLSAAEKLKSEEKSVVH